jgi:hypothetical protein
MDLDQISNSIDKLLNVNPWTRKERGFYSLLLSKIEKYQNIAADADAKTDAYSDINDVVEIQHNIKEQTWFKSSTNKHVITALLDSLKIVKCIQRGQPLDKSYSFILVLEFQSDIHMHIAMIGCYPQCQFRVYFEGSGLKAFVAAYSFDSKKGHTLPEYEKLCKLLPSLTRAEIVCFTSEILLYYDVHNVMKHIPMGNRYPVTFPKLLQKVQQLV